MDVNNVEFQIFGFVNVLWEGKYLNTFVRAQGYTYCVLLKNTDCKHVFLHTKTPPGTFKWASPTKHVFSMWCYSTSAESETFHKGISMLENRALGHHLDYLFDFDQNSILDTTLYNVESVTVYQLFPWWKMGDAMGNSLCKHTNTEQVKHRDGKFRHAGSIGKIRNRNKMPCNDVLMEFWKIT